MSDGGGISVVVVSGISGIDSVDGVTMLRFYHRFNMLSGGMVGNMCPFVGSNFNCI